LSIWTIPQEGSKQIGDKYQITATFTVSLSGAFTSSNGVEGKGTKCHLAVKFPDGWAHVTHTPNHWCNEDKMIDYITTMNEKRRHSGLDPGTVSSKGRQQRRF